MRSAVEAKGSIGDISYDKKGDRRVKVTALDTLAPRR
jgi:hypothetical protein